MPTRSFPGSNKRACPPFFPFSFSLGPAGGRSDRRGWRTGLRRAPWLRSPGAGRYLTPLEQGALWRHVRRSGGAGRWARKPCDTMRVLAEALQGLTSIQVYGRMQAMRMRRPNQVSEQLRKAIVAGSKSRYQIAKETGLDEGLLSRFVHRKSGLSMESIDLVSECLGLELVERRKAK